MKSESEATLCAVFVDYDNIYLSLRRKSEDAAKKFAKEAAAWLRQIEDGTLVAANDPETAPKKRRIVMSRCYGNPVPRRNSNDNSTDMNSFPFVRHHFLRAGFEVIDCPPLTAQLKNSADIRMVMDVRDVLTHETRFEEFIILSGDADFTPVLHRLRAHARRTAVFANDHTAAPYTALSDGEVREANLISLLTGGKGASLEAQSASEQRAPLTAQDLEEIRKQIVAEVATAVRGAAQPVPLESLADRAVRVIGHDRTAGSGWGGAGGFRDLLMQALPADIKITDAPPYYAFETTRQIATDIAARPELRAPTPAPAPALPQQTVAAPHVSTAAPAPAPAPLQAGIAPPQYAQPQPQQLPAAVAQAPAPHQYEQPAPAAPLGAQGHQPAAPYGQTASGHRLEQRLADRPVADGLSHVAPQAAPLSYAPAQPTAAPMPEGLTPVAPPQAAPAPVQQPVPQAEPEPKRTDAAAIQQSIARIHEACQAPPLSPPEYRVLFEVMAEEINANNLAGSQTLVNIGRRALDAGLEVRRDDIRFVLEVVSEADPWFEQGASANLFASRFRNFVVARCRSQGMTLTVEEIDLVDAWFGGATPQATAPQAPLQEPAGQQPATHGHYAPHQPQAPAPQQPAAYAAPQAPAQPQPDADDDYPRILRSRLRG